MIDFDNHFAETSEERVAMGVAFFDEHRPGWERSVDLSTLDPSDSTCCPGAQVFGSYNHAVEALVAAYPGQLEHRLTCEHGLLFARDTWAWCKAVKRRFETGVFSDDA